MMTTAQIFDFTNGVLDSRIVIARALNTATRVNNSGFIETVNADLPRFDYYPLTIAPKGLLIEESRSNAFIYSRSLSNGAWVKIQSSIGAVSHTDPWGNSTTEKLVENTATAARYIRQENVVTVLNNVIVISVLAKADGRNYIAILNPNASGGSKGRYFDITPGTSGAVLGALDGAPAASYIEKFGDWFLCSIVTTAGSTATAPRFYISPNGTSISYTGDGSSGVYLSDPQLEVGSFPTSRIPTEASAATRNADVATITGTAFSGFWRSGPGSILVRALPSTVSGTRPLVRVDDATADNSIALRGNTTNPELYIRAGGSDQATIDAGTISAAAYRLAGAWQAGSAAASLNSGLAVNGAPASIPAVTQMRLGSDGTNYLNGHLQAVQYWPVRLSNASLQNASSTAGYQSIIHPVSRDTIITEPV